jgi:hypothetical protein
MPGLDPGIHERLSNAPIMGGWPGQAWPSGRSYLLQKEPADFDDHLVDRVVGELREHRHAEDFVRRLFALAQPARPDRHTTAIGRLQMHRQPVMEYRCRSALGDSAAAVLAWAYLAAIVPSCAIS